MSQLPTDAIFVVVSMPLLIVFTIVLGLSAVGLLFQITMEIVWAVKARKQPASILTSNSDLSQEDTTRVRAVKIV